MRREQMKVFHILSLFAGLAALLLAQTPANEARTVGAVTKIDLAARALTVKTDAGAEVAVTLPANASFQRVAPGVTDLRKADTIAITDISVGDRVLVALPRVVVMSQGDIAKKQAAEQADWDKRGVF